MKSVLEYFRRNPGGWLSACSGGPDSMVMTHLMLKAGLKPVVAHVNYQKRGEASEEDEFLVRDFARRHGLEFLCKRVTEKPDGNFQAWASRIRYAWFQETAEALGLNRIATAHHADDQIETLLFRLMRGGHPADYSGISAQKGNIVRPMLNATKAEILRFAEKENIPFRVDDSNLESGYRRNYIRNEIIPRLDQQSSTWREKIMVLPRFASRYHQMTDRFLREVLKSGKDIDRVAWCALPVDFRKSVLAAWIRNVAGLQAERSRLDAFDALEDLETGGKLPAGSGWTIIRDRDRLVLQHHQESGQTDFLREISLNEIVTRSPVTVTPWLKMKTGRWSESPKKDCLELDLYKLKWPLKLRNWRQGDRIRPLGMQGSQLVSDVLTNRKISAAQKNQALVIEAFDQSLSAVIFPPSQNRPAGVVAEPVKCDSVTEETLEILPDNTIRFTILN